MKSVMKSVTIETDNGPKSWVRVSERTKQFLLDYPPQDGYRVVISRKDSLSYQTGRLELYKTAISHGQSIDKIGLPPLSESLTMVAEATLYGKDDKPIRMGSAAKQILQYKDWEQLETAAFQRLLAQLGYHGEILDEDEKGDISAVQETKPASPAPTPAPRAPDQPTVQGVATPPPEPPATPSEPKKDGLVKIDTLQKQGIPNSLLTQIRRHCKKRGIEVPELKNQQEALNYLAELTSPPATPATAVNE